MWFKKKSPEIVVRAGIKCELKYVYFVDNGGHISRQKSDRSSSPEFVALTGIMKDPQYYYFVDRNSGDIVRKKVDEQMSEEEKLQLQIADGDNSELREGIREKELAEEEDKELLEKFKEEEREKLRSKRLRKRARQELLEEEYEDIPEDEKVGHIPVEVKEFVWRRDKGKCVNCGSKENLEYDHIIPLSKGGSNSDRNIQLLCGKCNRSKRDSIV